MLALLILIIIFVLLFVFLTYNSLIKAKNRIELAELELQKYEESGSTEDIDNAKKYYHAVLRDYNIKVETWPFSMVADLFNFPKMHTDNFDEGL